MKTHFFILLALVCSLALPAGSASSKPREATETDLAESLSAMGCHVDVTVSEGKVCVESVSAGALPRVNSAVAEPLSEPLFLQLKELRCLRKLVLDYTSSLEPGPAALRNIAALPSLRELDLHGTGVNDQVMSYVCSLTNLESLGILDVSVGEQGIAQLSALTSLKKLKLYTHKAISERSMKVIARLPELDYLQIAGDIQEGAFSAVKAAAKLQTVAVGGPRGVLLLGELRGALSIQRIEILRAEVDPAVVERLRGIGNLSGLKLDCCRVTPEAAKVLSSLNLHQIECVQLRNDVLGDLARGMQQGYGNLTVGY